MSDDPLPPLDDDLRDLLAAERHRPDTLSDDDHARLLQRVRTQIAAPAATSASPASATPRNAHGLLRHAVTGLGGALLGAGLHAALQHPPPPRTVTVERVVERVVERRVEVPVVQYVPVVPDAAVDANVDATTPRAIVTQRPASGDDDSALVERARVALLRGSARDALTAVDEHARRFPRGQFAEEREAFAVQALVGVGRVPEARARAEAFHRRFPRSALGSSVDASLPPP